MIRPATPADLTRLMHLYRELHERSEFKERGVELSDNLVRSLLFDGVRKHGGPHAGSMFLMVAEKDGQVEAFMLGLLQPVYGVCVQLEAQDIALYATKTAPKIATTLLFGSYVAWASSSPRVVDIMASWTDVAGVDGERLTKLYRRRGFRRCGEIWKRGVR